MTNKKTTKTMKVVGGVGAGLVAAGAAAAGYYFFASKDAKKNRKVAATWATDLKKNIESEIKAVSSMEKEAVMNVIEKAVGVYNDIEDINKKDLAKAASELKKNWQKLVKPKAKK